MDKNKVKVYIAIGAAVLFAILLLWYNMIFENPGDKLAEANEDYKKGEESKTIIEREIHFNKALSTYLKLEKDYRPEFGDGKLYYNIANSYYQLGQYPYAIYYYHKAKKLMSSDAAVQGNLNTALEKLHMKKDPEPSIFHNIFFFHYYFSLPERLQILFTLTFVSLLIWSFYIWKPVKRIRGIGILFIFLLLIMLSSVLFTKYVSSLEAIIVRSSPLYKDAGLEFAKVSEKPYEGGLKVQVLGIERGGSWLWVLTPDGSLGYVPAENIKII